MPLHSLDTPTLFLLQGILHAVIAVTAWTVLAGRHRADLVGLWCLSGLFSGAGLLLIGLRGSVDEWLAYPLATFLSLSSYLLRIRVLQQELNHRSRWLALLALAILAVLGYEWIRQMGRDALEVYGAGVRVLASLWIASLALTLARREDNRSARLLAAVFLLAAMAIGLRLVAVLLRWGEQTVPTAMDYALINAVGLLIALYANLGYVGLVLERYRVREREQLDVLRAAQARQQEAEQHAGALEAMRAQRRDTLNESVPAMMHSIDAQGRLLAVSDTWLSKLGYTRDEVIGRPSIDFLTDESQQLARETVLPDFFRTGRCDGIAYRMRRRDGGTLEVSLSAVLVRDEGGAPLRSLAVLEDVTDVREKEAELAREHHLREQLEHHATQLDALVSERTEMLHVLAHEVRQPLHNAMAALRSAAGSDGAGNAQAVLRDVLASLDNTLASAALLAGSERLETQDADIDTLISIVLGDIPPEDRSRIRVERKTATRTVAMDTGLMRLALRNLISNALAYATLGTVVRLQLTDCDDPLALVLDVVDAGPGIESELQQRLFQRGQRGVQGGRQAGSGLGLYIVRRVMELHGGKVEALPSPGGGTQMRLWLPQGVED